MQNSPPSIFLLFILLSSFPFLFLFSLYSIVAVHIELHLLLYQCPSQPPFISFPFAISVSIHPPIILSGPNHCPTQTGRHPRYPIYLINSFLPQKMRNYPSLCPFFITPTPHFLHPHIHTYTHTLLTVGLWHPPLRLPSQKSQRPPDVCPLNFHFKKEPPPSLHHPSIRASTSSNILQMLQKHTITHSLSMTSLFLKRQRKRKSCQWQISRIRSLKGEHRNVADTDIYVYADHHKYHLSIRRNMLMVTNSLCISKSCLGPKGEPLENNPFRLLPQ